MTRAQLQNLNLSRPQLVGFVLIGGIVALSWFAELFGSPEDYLNDSIIDAGIIFATARGINALVSAFQGTQLDIWIVELSVGEFLDPVNDLIERFSGVMTMAIGALLIQKYLLAIFTHTVVNVVITILGALAIVAGWLGRVGAFNWFLKVFLYTFFLRVSLVLVVIANTAVDQIFLPGKHSADYGAMQSFHASLESMDRESRRGQVKLEFVGVAPGTMVQLEKFRVRLSKLKMDLMVERGRLSRAEERLPFAACLRDPASEACRARNEQMRKVESLELEISGVSSYIEALEGRVDKVVDDNAGCGVLSLKACKQALVKRLEDLQSQVTEFAGSVLSLLAAMIMKSIVMPLLFLYLLIQLSRSFWNSDSAKVVFARSDTPE